MKTFKDLLIDLRACNEGKKWAENMPIEEVVEKCHRGDWLLWLAERLDVDKRLLTLTKGHCANTVRHLMTDERSMSAIDTAIRYGNGEIGEKELSAAAAAAYAAAAYAADAAAAAAYAAAYDAYAADAAAYAAAAYASASAVENRLLTADICREYLGEKIIDEVNKLLQK